MHEGSLLSANKEEIVPELRSLANSYPKSASPHGAKVGRQVLLTQHPQGILILVLQTTF